MILHGERVRLRPLRPEDAPALAAIQNEPGVRSWWGAGTEAHYREKVDATDTEGYVVELAGEAIGFIEEHEENDPDYRHAGIDLFVGDAFQGQGLGTDALRTLVRDLFAQRGHHRITIDPAADNEAAIRSYEKVGFRRVGVLREYWRDADGVWRDGLLMDLLARELAER